MRKKDFEKLLKHEQNIFEFTGLFLPVIQFIVLFLIFIFTFIYESLENLIVGYFFLILTFPIIFFIVYRRGFRRYRKKAKSAKYYFKSLSYSKAVIRLNFLDKILLCSVIALVILGVISATGVQASLQIIEKNEELYFQKAVDYNEIKEQVERMNDDELNLFLKKEIDSFKNYQLRNYVSQVIQKELESDAQVTDNLELKENVFKTAKDQVENMTYEQLRGKAFQNIDRMNSDELKSAALTKVENLKPQRFLLDDESYAKQNAFLIFLAAIPGFMVYTLYIFRSPITRQADFHYYFSIACFKTVQNVSSMDELEKRKYLIKGIIHYDKFIKKNLRMRINNLDRINSEFLSDSSKKLSESAASFVDKLEKGHQLELLKFLDSKLKHVEPSPLLTTDPLSDRLKGVFPFIVSTITAITIILSSIIPQFYK